MQIKFWLLACSISQGKVGLEEEIRRQEEQSAHYDAALHSFKGDMLTSLSEEVAKLQCNDILKVKHS